MIYIVDLCHILLSIIRIVMPKMSFLIIFLFFLSIFNMLQQLLVNQPKPAELPIENHQILTVFKF
jgi:hypothetical protein